MNVLPAQTGNPGEIPSARNPPRALRNNCFNVDKRITGPTGPVHRPFLHLPTEKKPARTSGEPQHTPFLVVTWVNSICDQTRAFFFLLRALIFAPAVTAIEKNVGNNRKKARGVTPHPQTDVSFEETPVAQYLSRNQYIQCAQERAGVGENWGGESGCS